MAPAASEIADSAGRPGTQSVDRAFAVLKLIAAARQGGIRLADLSRAAQLNKSTTHRLLKCLATHGAIRFDAEAEGYVLGPLALDLAIAAGAQLSVRERAAEIIARAARHTGDTIFFLLRSEDDSICIDRASGAYPVRPLVVEVGTRRPLGVGAAATAMLGAMTDEKCRQIILRNRARLAPYGVTPEFALKAAAAARRLGYAALATPLVEGVKAIGVAVLGDNGEPVAAIAIAAIDRRMSRARQQELVGIMQEAAVDCRKAVSG